MEREEIKKIFSSFLEKYPEEQRKRIWENQSSDFRKFWNQKIMNIEEPDLSDDQIDSIIRILDSHGKGNNRQTEAIAAAMIPQVAFRRMFNAIKRNNEVSGIIDEILKTTSDKVRAEKIDELYKTTGKSIGYLTGPSGNAINLFLAAWDPFINSSIVSLNHRNKFINGLGILYDLSQYTIGEQIVKTNTLINEFFKDLGFPANARTISFFAYHSDFKDVWNINEESIKFESNEDLAFRLLLENADQETILAEFRKVYKAKKDVTDDDFIKSRVEIYMNLARKRLNLEPGILNESNSGYKSQVRYWLYAPGENAKYWDHYYIEGSAGIGPNVTGDLNQYSNQDELGKKIDHIRGEGRHSNDTLALWEFSKVMKPGDIIIAKKGINFYLGYGIVLTDYCYNDERTDFHHFRKVKWRSNGLWTEDTRKLPIKTLTDITDQVDLVDRLKELLKVDEIFSPADMDFDPIFQTKRKYWWINANPKFWNIDEFQVGQTQSYTTHNESGNKRRVYDYFKQLKPGDQIIGYQSTPALRIKALFEVTEGISQDEDGNEAIFFKVKEFFPYQAKWEELKEIPELQKCEVFINNQGSLFKLNPHEFTSILTLCSKGSKIKYPKYELKNALSEIFISEENLSSILDLLKYKKNIILQGPPGTGKTFIARRLAHLAMGEKDNSRIEMVQFHQSYAYEDFIQGFRPKEDGKFRLQNGVFYDFCLRAQRDPDHKYFFIIDEINRGNLSKIFGELMMLIEHDKRGIDFGIRLTYSEKDSDNFYIPENVYLIGTMNTADRSLAIVDYALRRRFVFVTIPPAFCHPGFEQLLKDNGVNTSLIAKIKSRMEEINCVITSDDNLRKSFSVGHSYFCTKVTNPNEMWYRQIIENEIGPLLKEYWFDDEQKADENIKKLLRD